MPAHARIDRILADLQPETLRFDSARSQWSLGERMQALMTPGISVAVMDDFDVTWARGVGTRRWQAPEPVETTTPFQAGSISKAVFALAVMRLCQDGVLDLDAEIGNYLKSWRLPRGDGG